MSLCVLVQVPGVAHHLQEEEVLHRAEGGELECVVGRPSLHGLHLCRRTCCDRTSRPVMTQLLKPISKDNSFTQEGRSPYVMCDM